MKEQIDQARWIAVMAATALALYLCWLMLRPFIGVLAWAIVLVIVFYPVHQRLKVRIKRPWVSALLSCVLVVLLAVLPLTVLTVAVAEELSAAVPNLPAKIASVMNPQTSLLGRASEWIQGRFGIDTSRSEQFMADQLQRAGQFLLSLSWNLAGGIASGIVKAFFVVFTMYYLFRDGDKIVSKLPAALPLERQQSKAIITRTSEVVSASVYGIVVIASLQGLLGGLAFWILGIPSPLLWAVLMTFVCMIPVLGSFLVWLPWSIFLFANGHVTKGILLVLWGALVISTIDNFLRPKWMKNQTRLHELLVFFSVLGGISVFGLLGIVLGPVVLAITLGLLQTFRAHQTVDGPLDEF
ncbi:MAG TPA: AI-2E family transporter [Pyrinomonadaceae bacterium]|nr:AI-2E family transporter [Pyrinomonadaceae bacterium]